MDLKQGDILTVKVNRPLAAQVLKGDRVIVTEVNNGISLFRKIDSDSVWRGSISTLDHFFYRDIFKVTFKVG